MTEIRPCTYKDTDALLMENENLQITVIPQSGGKIQSFYDKVLGREFLYQSSGSHYLYGRYGESFLDGDMSGFDEMFPGVSSGPYPDYPWQGSLIPDHGEVWALPWDVKILDSLLKLTVHGVKFPYVLGKDGFVRCT